VESIPTPPDVPPGPPPGLGYATAHAGRPGLVTAIGVMSVVVGSAGILGAALQGMMVVTWFVALVAFATSGIPVMPAPVIAANTATAPAGATGLSAIQRPAVSAALQSRQTMSTDQYMQLDNLLDTCGGNIFPGLSPSSDPTAAVGAAVVGTGTTPATQPTASAGVFFTTRTGRIDVDDDGATFTPAGGSAAIHTSQSTSPGVSVTIGAAPSTRPAPPMPYLPFICAIVQCSANLGLAIFLLVLGIMTLRQSARAARLHLIYCWLKIPLCVLGVGALFWFSVSMIDFLGSVGPASSALPAFLIFFSVLALLGLAYPVGLLIALRTRTVRTYYQSVTA